MWVVRREDVREPFVGPNGDEFIYEMIGRPAERGGTVHHSFVHVVIPPGKCSAAHFHKVTEETYYILTGAARLVVDDNERTLTSADAALIMPPQVHQIFNLSATEDLEFLAISAPAFTPDDFHLVGDAG